MLELLHDARPVRLDLGAQGAVDLPPRVGRVCLVDAEHVGTWELPVIGTVTAPEAVAIRPDGQVARVGRRNAEGPSRNPHDLVRPADAGGRLVVDIA